MASGAARRTGSNEQLQPWREEGVSRRTWYRDASRSGLKMTDGGARRGVVSSSPGAALGGTARQPAAVVAAGEAVAAATRRARGVSALLSGRL